MNRYKRKIIFVILLNVFLVGLTLFILDQFNVLHYREILSFVGIKDNDQMKVEDPFLLMKEELKKQKQILELKERKYSKDVISLANLKQKLKDQKDRLVDLDAMMKKKEKQIKITALQKTKRGQRIKTIANQLMQMEPQKAVDRIEVQKDDLLVIDILMMMDKLFTDAGKKSSVPYILSLMDKTRAATLQRKIANIPQVKDDEL